MPLALLLFSLPSFQGNNEERKKKKEAAQHRPPLSSAPQKVLEGTLSHLLYKPVAQKQDGLQMGSQTKPHWAAKGFSSENCSIIRTLLFKGPCAQLRALASNFWEHGSQNHSRKKKKKQTWVVGLIHTLGIHSVNPFLKFSIDWTN